MVNSLVKWAKENLRFWAFSYNGRKEFRLNIKIGKSHYGKTKNKRDK